MKNPGKTGHYKASYSRFNFQAESIKSNRQKLYINYSKNTRARNRNVRQNSNRKRKKLMQWRTQEGLH